MTNHFDSTSNPQYSQFIALSRYARWLEDENRRETWEETVDRYVDFFKVRFDKQAITVSPEQYTKLREAILNLEVMPSMRALMTAGKALDVSNVAGFNCSYIVVDNPRAFDETMYILTCGTGLGFSVERQYVSKLPEVSETFHPTDTVIKVADSRKGWAKAYRELISLLYAGQIPKWDVSEVRPMGARLKTFGGRASGAAPLESLFEFTIDIFKKARGRKLSSLECHDIMCKIADIVVVGGVRRCLPANAPVATTLGTVEIQNINVGDKVITGGKEYTVLAKEATGEKQTLKIQHRFGELICTPEHQVAVFDSIGNYIFKEAGDLVVDDRLVWDYKGYAGTTQSFNYTQNAEPHFNATPVKFPTVLTDDLAWLIGVIHGDGYVGGGGLEIATAAKEVAVLERAGRIIKDIFGLESSITNLKNENCKRIRIHSREMCKWLLDNVKKPNVPLRVPNFINNATVSNRAAYLAGLFDSDGRSRKDGICEQVTTIYEDFKTDIVTLLSTLGIGTFSSFIDRSYTRAMGKKTQDAYTIKVSGTTNKHKWLSLVAIHCVSGKQSRVVCSGKSPIDFSYPASMLDLKKFTGHRNSSLTFDFYSKKSDIDMDTIAYLPTPILSIEDNGIVPTYDIEIEEAKQFTTCGIVVHNSALISLSNLSDDRMRDSKKGQFWHTDKQRELANNSACYTEKPEFSQFMKEWFALHESKCGERGIFNRVASQRQAAKSGRRDTEHEFGTNPCCLAGDTLIMTTQGYKKISDLQGIAFTAVLNKQEYAAPNGSWIAGEADIYKLETESGHVLYLTKEHKIITQNKGWVEAQNLTTEDQIIITTAPYTTNFKSFEFDRVGEVWDAEVSGVHCFDANGIVAHNSEIILRPNQFCNLSEVVVRATDTLETLKQKVINATILGSFQATLTDFDYIRAIWKRNTEEEALLGVSLTGIMDNDVLAGRKGYDVLAEWLEELKEVAISTNKVWAEVLGINQSVAVTCVKPSGTVSQLVDSASGIHDRYAPYYLRRVRADAKDPLAQFMKEKGFPCEEAKGKPEVLIFSFPIGAPEGCSFADNRSAIDQLKHWKIYQEHWCEHKPSVTIYYSDDEFLEVGQYVWEHFDDISGISFLPRGDGHVYVQAPYEEITKEQFDTMTAEMPIGVDWKDLALYELEDGTTGTQQLACSGNVCEMVDLSTT